MLGHADLATTELYTHVTDRRRRESYFRGAPPCQAAVAQVWSAQPERKNRSTMTTLDPQLTTLFAVTTGVGYLMIQSGLQKSMLEWRRRKRSCPSCGRELGPPAAAGLAASASASASVARPTRFARRAELARPASSSSARCSSSTIVSRCGEPLRRQTSASRRTASLSSAFASSCRSERTSLTGRGWSRESSSSETSAEPRHAGLSSSSPRRSSSSFCRKRNWPIARYATARCAVVRLAGGRLELVRPLRAQVGELALVAALAGERVGRGGGLDERQAGWSERGAGPT